MSLTVKYGKQVLRVNLLDEEEEEEWEEGWPERIPLSYLLDLLSNETDLPVERIKLLHAGALMADPKKSLAAYGIREDGSSKVMMLASKEAPPERAATAHSNATGGNHAHHANDHITSPPISTDPLASLPPPSLTTLPPAPPKLTSSSSLLHFPDPLVRLEALERYIKDWILPHLEICEEEVKKLKGGTQHQGEFEVQRPNKKGGHHLTPSHTHTPTLKRLQLLQEYIIQSQLQVDSITPTEEAGDEERDQVRGRRRGVNKWIEGVVMKRVEAVGKGLK